MSKKKPIIFAVDDEPQVLSALQRDLRKQYRKEYKVMSTTSVKEALETLQELKNKNEVVALFLSDQRMPEMLGVEYLEQAVEVFPEAKRVLVTAYSDIEAAIKGINDVQLDYYITKPWNPPEEKLFPVIQDLLDVWQMNYKPGFNGIRILGYQFSPKSHQIKDFLAGNLVPYQWLDIEQSEEAQQLATLNNIDYKNLPAVFFEDGEVLTNPSLIDIGTKTGHKSQASDTMYDVAIIGAGPAGLSAAVYGGSEGLKTLLIERRAPGGQAGTSSRIENYLGFPSGLSGQDLSRRAITQATRFGIEFLSPVQVNNIETKDNYKIITLDDGKTIHTRAVIVTTGVDYRKLEAPGMNDFTGAGIYYGAATTEAAACRNKDVYIVGGGNSAGQGAMYLAKFANHVYIVVRRPDLSISMSQYLIDQIAGTENITLLPYTTITAAKGSDHLQQVVLQNTQTKAEEEREAGALFIFIGAKPYTEWIDLEVLRNQRGFLETGRELLKYHEFHKAWIPQREPFLLETSVPGIFAAGDVRAGAMNRVASAVGEGAMAIKFVHEYLAEN
ncbi:FAD-dependent oxidoreductase [Microscilla marina]|uniref:Thioredoxin reductase carring response regulator receiver domain n=1 Tax=Microscilla marina ATCC 23134 TaxID=313606 RepID=A1ZFS2_MICM2|nr:FAD-dependent oxidoreductase [Microscilla marina]EAY30846.1 thioredoxin reductase carring response regulator receiver domain [Microscilla marina ATCC 23134]